MWQKLLTSAVIKCCICSLHSAAMRKASVAILETISRMLNILTFKKREPV